MEMGQNNGHSTFRIIHTEITKGEKIREREQTDFDRTVSKFAQKIIERRYEPVIQKRKAFFNTLPDKSKYNDVVIKFYIDGEWTISDFQSFFESLNSMAYSIWSDIDSSIPKPLIKVCKVHYGSAGLVLITLSLCVGIPLLLCIFKKLDSENYQNLFDAALNFINGKSELDYAKAGLKREYTRWIENFNERLTNEDSIFPESEKPLKRLKDEGKLLLVDLEVFDENSEEDSD